MIVALCLSLGGHWLALQSIAWTTMLVANMRSAPLCQAVAKTFDGSHPCQLCHAVANANEPGKKSDTLPTITKLDLICTTQPLRCLPPWELYTYHTTPSSFPERSTAPPAPPPRDLLGT